jgi:hypothetical protein
MYSPVKENKVQRIVHNPKKKVVYGKRTIDSNKKEYIKK